jgi:hypothetical protein
MRNLIFLIIIVFHLVILYHRLPDWNSDLSIWMSAAKVEQKDPWVLNNAAHYAHDKRTILLLFDITKLKVPEWLPLLERQPYYIGYKGLANSLRASGYQDQADLVESKLTEMMFGHPPIVTYVTIK